MIARILLTAASVATLTAGLAEFVARVVSRT